MMNISHKWLKWATLFSQIGLNRTFLKQSSILWRCPTEVGDIAKLGTPIFSDFLTGGSWYGLHDQTISSEHLRFMFVLVSSLFFFVWFRVAY